ncbi:hypothetical protein [Salegentibacter mishustinae]|uniref:hypothetical protein n=1 Tax=Salegentibacter mishustinae TaxID=270918 RepID=UPI00248FFCD9|nr:hypothetical protein [Salegentibacter mishustinae]
MDDIEFMQSEINNFAIEAFKDYQGGLNLSVPLVPRISENYLKNKVVVVGQETNTWYRTDNKPDTDDLQQVFLKNLSKVDKICLEKRYDVFIKDIAGKYGGNFWRFQRMLYERNILGGEMIENSFLSHCWINLFSVEACINKKDENGRPTKNKRLGHKIINLQGNLLFEILRVLKPELIIFVTGNSLDSYLRQHGINDVNSRFEGLDKSGILGVENLAEVVISDDKHCLHGTRIIRSYHPTYFMGKINTYKKLRRKLDKINWKGSNADYYRETLFKVISNKKF